MKPGYIVRVDLGERRIPHGAWIVAGVTPVILGICRKILLRRESAREK
jgi:hypothetical protein